jgi:hypothetical protein
MHVSDWDTWPSFMPRCVGNMRWADSPQQYRSRTSAAAFALEAAEKLFGRKLRFREERQDTICGSDANSASLIGRAVAMESSSVTHDI